MSHRFAVFDIDGTLIRWQLYHVIVNKLAKAGVLGDDAYGTLKQAMMVWKRRETENAYKDYEAKLVQIYEKALPDISTELFDRLVKEAMDEYQEQTYVYTRNLMRRLKQEGYRLLIVSGSHTELIERLAGFYGFDDWIGTQYERDAQGFTGRIAVSTLDKKKSLQVLLDRNDVTLAGSMGIGDSGGDIAMLEMVDTAIAFNPDKKLFEAAKAHGWKLVIERKNVVYELERLSSDYILRD